MPRLIWALVALCALLCTTSQSFAITPEAYAALNCADQERYTNLMVAGTISNLTQHDDTAGLEKIRSLLNDDSGKGFLSQFLMNISEVQRVNNASTSDPAHKTYQVEHAFSLTLKRADVKIPVSFVLELTKDFKPSPPQKYVAEPDPAWLASESADYQKAYHDYMKSIGNAKKTYADGLCQLRKDLAYDQGLLAFLDDHAIVMAGGQRVYLTNSEKLVYGSGTELTGQDLAVAEQMIQQRNGNASSYEKKLEIEADVVKRKALQQGVPKDFR